MPAITSDVEDPSFYDFTAVKLYSHAAILNRPGNFVISPASIIYATLLLHLGAKGKSASDIIESFDTRNYFGNTDAHFVQNVSDSAKRLTNSASQITINNGIFIDKDFPLDPSYASRCRTLFNASIANLDFGNHPLLAEKEINSWVSNRTNGLIDAILAPETINPLTLLILINTVHFKGKWEAPFTPLEGKADFQNVDGTIAKIEFMEARNVGIRIMPDETFDFLVIYYEEYDCSLLLLSPKNWTDFRGTEGEYNAKSFSALHELSMNARANLTLPKFKLPSSFDLITLLQSIGITEVFNKGTADLSGMSAKANLVVSQAVHKATIEVNEEGTEASAASVIGSMNRVATFEPHVSVKINRPFIYAVRHNPTGVILFIGRVESLS